MSTRRARGSVLVELAMIIPLMIIISILAVEFTRALRHLKIAMSLSREAANIAFRECADIKTLVTTPCLQLAQAKVTAFAGTLVPGANVTITVGVRRVHTGGGGGTSSYVRTEPDPLPAVYQGVAPACVGRVAGLLGTGTAGPGQNEAIVCGHARVPYRPLLPVLHGLFGFSYDIDHVDDETLI